MKGLSIKYFLTEKGIKLKFVDARYEPEEREIIEILRDGRKSISLIRDEMNKSLNTKRTWDFVEKRLKLLKREGLVDEFE